MEDKELEKILQEKADKTQMRKFSEVWNEIKDEIVVPKQEKKVKFKKWLPMVLTSAALVVCLVISPIIINSLKPASDEVYYSEELIMRSVLEEEMFDDLSQASISHVDMTKYTVDGCSLLLTRNNKVKGATFRMYCENQPSFFASIKLYDKTVDLKLDLKKTYDSNCKINSTDVHYKFKQEIDGAYVYSVYASKNGVQYQIEYTGFSDNLTEFLTEFFA